MKPSTKTTKKERERLRKALDDAMQRVKHLVKLEREREREKVSSDVLATLLN